MSSDEWYKRFFVSISSSSLYFINFLSSAGKRQEKVLMQVQRLLFDYIQLSRVLGRELP
jgi:hypothetical protein